MKEPVFSGTCTALVTPFLNDHINYPLVQRMILWQQEQGVHSFILAGTTGEAPTLTDAEKLELFAKGKEYAGPHCKIIAGTGGNCTAHAVELSKEAELVGVDALLLVAPYYNKGNTHGLYEHFAAIAASVSIPIILYNVPGRTGVDIPVEVYRRLSEIPNINGVKEASTNIKKVAQIRSACPEDFYIWSGNDDLAIPAMSIGAIGLISVLSNVLPAETVAMTAAAQAGDFKTAGSIQCNMLPLIDALFCEVNPIPVKYAMKHCGFDCGPCRLPLGAPAQETAERIDNLFQ